MHHGEASRQKTIHRLFERLISSFPIAMGYSPLERGKVVIMVMLSFLALVIFLPLSIHVLLAGDVRTGLVTIATIVCQWISLAMLRFSRRSRAAYVLSALSLAMSIVYAILSGGFQGSGILYVFLAPLAFSFLLDWNLGLVLSTAIGLVFLIIILTPDSLARYYFLPSHLSRMFFLYVLNSVVNTAVVAVFRENQRRIEHVAFYDELTGRPNRRYIEQQLDKQLLQSQGDQCPLLICFISITRFRFVNDNFGYAVGDRLIRQFADRVSLVLPKQSFFGRFGGTDFVLTIPSGWGESAQSFCSELHAINFLPYIVNQAHLHLSMNISYMIFPFTPSEIPAHGNPQATEAVDSKWITKNLEVTLQSLPKNSGGQTIAYDAQSHMDIRRKYLMAEALKDSLKSGEMYLHYQPIIDGRSMSLHKVELLARWESRSFGPVSPELFIPLAEETGFIQELTQFQLTQALDELSSLGAFDGTNANAGNLNFAFNMSPILLHSKGCVDFLLTAIEKRGVKPDQLICEITESLLLEDDQIVHKNLEDFSRSGISLALDDFGTGYSSLSYLQRFPVSILKIDRSFILSMDESSSSVEIIRAVLAMARTLGIQCVAEGVETQYQFEVLREMGCDFFQGYYFARPMDAWELNRWIADWDKACKLSKQI